MSKKEHEIGQPDDSSQHRHGGRLHAHDALHHPHEPGHHAFDGHTPFLAQNYASVLDKVDGIMAQTRADVGTASMEKVTGVLHQRLKDSGIELPEDEVAALARRVREHS